jgi:4-hydroxybenzoate polyprenyltransferase
MHAGAFGALTTAWLLDDRLGPVFGVAVVIVGALLGAEHLVLVRRGKDGLQMAFFTLNGVVSLVAGGLGILAIIIP